jgi:hypothetical protein
MGDTFKITWLEYPNEWLTPEEKRNLQWKADSEYPADNQAPKIALEGVGRYMQEMVIADVNRILQKVRSVSSDRRHIGRL